MSTVVSLLGLGTVEMHFGEMLLLVLFWHKKYCLISAGACKSAAGIKKNPPCVLQAGSIIHRCITAKKGSAKTDP